ncbi:hypothetical protein MKX01_031689 [Papaver californicum]|nr:hypothetical protein MKX01_031689 [Papaver californicum]
MVTSSFSSFVLCCLVIFGTIFVSLDAQLTPVFYDKACPRHFQPSKICCRRRTTHGSILTPAVNSACGNVVSCADILAVASRDSVATLGGPSYEVLLGRQDALNARWMDANTDLPLPFLNLTGLLTSFTSKGFNLQDLVVISAAHTIGVAQCTTFRGRIYGNTNIEPSGDSMTVALDGTPNNFDNAFFNNLLAQKGLLHSDQELFKHDFSAADFLVRRYSTFPEAFFKDFGDSMIKMGNLRSSTELQ